MTLEEEAIKLDAEAERLEALEHDSFIRKGEIMAKMQDQDRWSYLINPKNGRHFDCYEAWVSFRFPTSRSSAYAAKAVVRELGDSMPREVLAKIDRGNFPVLKKLPSSAQKNPTVQLLATTLPPREFESKARSLYPDHHIEATVRWALNPTVSQAAIYNDAMSKATEFYAEDPSNPVTREEAMEYILQDFIDSARGDE